MSTLPQFDSFRPESASDPHTFFCPDEASPVSHSVHLARLAAGWPGCNECRWRFRDLNLNEAVTRRVDTTLERRVNGIRRTAFGVRGAYLNDLDRAKAAQLAAIFSTHLAASWIEDTAADPVVTDEELAAQRELRPRRTAAITIVAGFDGRRHSPDIFAGVVSAATQNGCHVIDIGRCSTASLHECLRNTPAACAAMIVTGAGQFASHTGLDVFDASGEAVCVPWQQFGVAVQSVHTAAPPQADEESGHRDQIHSRPIRDILDRLRGTTGADTQPPIETLSALTIPETRLTLPTLQHGTGRAFRSVRTSGQHRHLDFEPVYQRWIRQWFPETVQRRVVILAQDSLTATRLRLLTDTSGAAANLLIAELAAAASPEVIQAAVSANLTRFGAEAACVIGEDDRFADVFNRSGQRLTVTEQVAWLNRSVRNSAGHVTAHVSSDDRPVTLLDAGRPQSGESHDTISDGLALTGLILNVLNHRSNALPV